MISSTANKEELETISCGICGSEKYTFQFMSHDYVYHNTGEWPVAKCDSCGVIYMNPRIPPAMIGDYYPKNYYTIAAGAPGQTSWGRALFNTAAAKLGYSILTNEPLLKRIVANLALPYTMRCSLIRKVIVPVPNGKILDVGCGNGETLSRYASLGWKTFGLEVSTASAKFAADAGHEIIVGDLLQANYPDNEFDTVTLWDALEHIHNPMEIMIEVKRILKPGGRIYISVPNVGSWYARKFRDRWYMFTSPVHYYHYTGDTLTKLLTNAGFSNTKISFPLGAVGIPHTLEILAKDNPPRLRILNNKLVAKIISWVDRFAPFGHVDANAMKPL